MLDCLKKHKLILGIIVYFFFMLPYSTWYTILLFSTMIVLHIFYSLFYNQPPKIREFFMSTGILLAMLSLIHSSFKMTSLIQESQFLTWIIYVFTLIASIECMRMVIMAILRYPVTIKDLKVLTEELEERVEQRTRELKTANEQLHEANLRLQELDTMKSAFVSQASHDLRTPLTAIKGSLDNLNLGIAGELNEKQKKIMDRAIRSVDRLTNLINDVLDLNRIESGRIVLEKHNISFKTLVENILHEQKPAMDQKKLRLNFHVEDGEYHICIDGGKMERVVGELIGNAVKYTPEGGLIQITLSSTISLDLQRKNAILLSVEDSGIGMTPEECQKIWERFYRTPASKHFAKGSGLGLSIVKELTELHGGKIDITSQQGKGSIFTLILPN